MLILRDNYITQSSLIRINTKTTMHIVHPFTMMVAGPSGCGKTTFVLDLLRHMNAYEKIKKILWCNGVRNAIPSDIYSQNNIEILKTVPETFDNIENDTLIILDDLMTEAYNKNICELFTKGSHHNNLSVILITQNVFHQAKFCRDISLNCKYLVVFKNPRDKSQILSLARQIYPENSTELMRVYNEATSRPHGYLFFDLTQAANDLMRFRTNIFKKDYIICYCPAILLENKQFCMKNETINGEQTYSACFKKL